MSDAARLAQQSFATKPENTPYAKFTISRQSLESISAVIGDAVVDTAYGAVVSYAEALAGVRAGSSSWTIVRLYYSSFYSIKALLFLNNIIPFNHHGEMMLDISTGNFLKGGRSSHHWNWTAFKSTNMQKEWFFSQDSQDAYTALRKDRENVSYTHAFTDPVLHESLICDQPDLTKRFRTYRDDNDFLYTYLSNHRAVAYPTKLILHLDAQLKKRELVLHQERVSHIQTIWKFKDRCPLT